MVHNLMLGAGVITECTRNNKSAMHNMHVTAAYKILLVIPCRKYTYGWVRYHMRP